MRKNEIRIETIVVATGITSVVTQLYVIREFLVQYTGNEYVIALLFFSWLMLGGGGTLLARLATAHGFPVRPGWLGSLSLILVGLSPATILGIRTFKHLFFLQGTSVGFYPTFWYIFLLLIPYGVLLGFLLPYSLYVMRQHQPGYRAARIYITDNLGDVSGGALFSFVLVHLLTPIQAVCLAGLPLLFLAAALFEKPRFGRIIYGISAALVLSGLALSIYWETVTLTPQVGKLVHYQESRFGRVELHRNKSQHTLFLDGMPVFSDQNQVTAEEMVHYPLCQIDSVRTVLVISATGGMIEELGKYDPDSIDYVELDPVVSQTLFQYRLLHKRANVRVINQDGRTWIMHTGQKYDAVIVNLPEPATFQLNRFYTDRFFQQVKACLKPGGIFSFSMQGFDNYLAEPQRQKISSVFNTVAGHFKNVLLLPGQNIYFLCRDGTIHRDIPGRLKDRRIATDYIRNYFDGNVTPWRIDQLNRLIDPATKKNYDQAPRLMQIMFHQWFAKFATSPKWFLTVVFTLLVIFLLRLRATEYVLFTTGCMTMGCELMIVFAFQIYYGYIYYQIGLIVTVFLAGLLPGAWLGDQLRKNPRRVLTWTDGLLISLLAFFIFFFLQIGDKLPVLFYLGTGFLVSVLCGCQFPVAILSKKNGQSSVAKAFSADLIGAAAGSLITSVILIPYLGIIGAAAALIFLKTTSLIVTGVHHG